MNSSCIHWVTFQETALHPWASAGPLLPGFLNAQLPVETPPPPGPHSPFICGGAVYIWRGAFGRRQSLLSSREAVSRNCIFKVDMDYPYGDPAFCLLGVPRGTERENRVETTPRLPPHAPALSLGVWRLVCVSPPLPASSSRRKLPTRVDMHAHQLRV